MVGIVLRHPLWLVGFRPFFALAMLAGASLPLWWVGMVSGTVPPAPTLARNPLLWHAHEMLFGFGWATLAGFLLTASKNWVGVRGWHGAALAVPALLWLADRVALATGDAWPPVLFWAVTLSGVAFVVGLLLHTLVRNQKHDSYRVDNRYFLIALPLFPLAKALLLTPEYFTAGVAMTLALFRLAFLLMLERTLTQFMSGAFKHNVPRSAFLDHAIKGLALALVATPWLPVSLAGTVNALLAVLITLRCMQWSPRLAFSRLEIGIMMFGMLAIAAHLALLAVNAFVPQVWIALIATHVFTLGCIGCIVPAMFVRIVKGHTGRKVAFERADRAVLWLVLAALEARILPPALVPSLYLPGLWLAALCWSAAFGLLAVRYLPFLLAPRLDGREH
jgi:uncharacterized protein involved in response to NO